MGIERRSDTNTPKQSDKLDIFSDTIKLEEKNTLDPLKQDLSELKNQVQINPKPPTK